MSARDRRSAVRAGCAVLAVPAPERRVPVDGAAAGHSAARSAAVGGSRTGPGRGQPASGRYCASRSA